MTMDELTRLDRDLHERIANLRRYLKIDDRLAEQTSLEAKMADPNFWDDKESAQETVAKLSSCRNVTEPFKALENRLSDIAALIELAADDPALLDDADGEVADITRQMDKLEVMSFLSGRFDRSNFYCSIYKINGFFYICPSRIQ